MTLVTSSSAPGPSSVDSLLIFLRLLVDDSMGSGDNSGPDTDVSEISPYFGLFVAKKKQNNQVL